MATLPEHVGLSSELAYTVISTNTFLIDWTLKQIAGMDAGLPAMRQAVEIILANERYRGRFITAILAVNWRICLGKNLTTL